MGFKYTRPNKEGAPHQLWCARVTVGYDLFSQTMIVLELMPNGDLRSYLKKLEWE